MNNKWTKGVRADETVEGMSVHFLRRLWKKEQRKD